MAKVLVNESSLQDIADAIREKTEGTETFLPSTMGAAIRAMETGGAVKTATGTGTVSSGITGLDFTPFAVAIASSSSYGLYHTYTFHFFADGDGNIIHGTGKDISYQGAASTFMSKCSVYEGGFKCTGVSGSQQWIAVGV